MEELKELIFETDDVERLEALAKLAITRLNEIKSVPNKEYFLGVITDAGRMPKKQRLYDCDKE